MKANASRRNFLAAGLAMPAAAMGSYSSTSQSPGQASAAPKDAGLRYRALGKTGLKLTAVSMGCMITSDGSVVERAVDAGINYFDTAWPYHDGSS